MTIQFKVMKPMEMVERMSVHDTEVVTRTATLAMRFAEIILQSCDYGKNLGNALSERQPHEHPAKPVEVEVISRRACDLAECLMLEMRKREMFAIAPDISDVYPDEAAIRMTPPAVTGKY